MFKTLTNMFQPDRIFKLIECLLVGQISNRNFRRSTVDRAMKFSRGCSVTMIPIIQGV